MKNGFPLSCLSDQSMKNMHKFNACSLCLLFNCVSTHCKCCRWSRGCGINIPWPDRLLLQRILLLHIFCSFLKTRKPRFLFLFKDGKTHNMSVKSPSSPKWRLWQEPGSIPEPSVWLQRLILPTDVRGAALWVEVCRPPDSSTVAALWVATETTAVKSH